MDRMTDAVKILPFPKFRLRVVIIILSNVSRQNNKYLNIVILMAKQYLYAFKGLQEMPTLIYLTKRLHNMYITEKAIAYKKTKVQNLKRNGNFILDV